MMVGFLFDRTTVLRFVLNNTTIKGAFPIQVTRQLSRVMVALHFLLAYTSRRGAVRLEGH